MESTPLLGRNKLSHDLGTIEEVAEDPKVEFGLGTIEEIAEVPRAGLTTDDDTIFEDDLEDQNIEGLKSALEMGILDDFDSEDDTDSDKIIYPSDVSLKFERSASDSSNGSWKESDWTKPEEEITFAWPRSKSSRVSERSTNSRKSNRKKKSKSKLPSLFGGNYMQSGNRQSVLPAQPVLGHSSVKPLKIWYRKLVIRQACHSYLAEHFCSRDMYSNTISVAITALTSSAIFTSLVKNDHEGTKLSQAGPSKYLALSAGILAALNTILQAIMKNMAYARRGESHLNAFKQYTKMRFKMENLVGDTVSYYHHDGVDNTLLDEWVVKYEELLELEPIIPQEIFEYITDKEDNAGLKWTKPPAIQ